VLNSARLTAGFFISKIWQLHIDFLGLKDRHHSSTQDTRDARQRGMRKIILNMGLKPALWSEPTVDCRATQWKTHKCAA